MRLRQECLSSLSSVVSAPAIIPGQVFSCHTPRPLSDHKAHRFPICLGANARRVFYGIGVIMAGERYIGDMARDCLSGGSEGSQNSVRLVIAGSRSVGESVSRFLAGGGRRVVARAIVGACPFERSDVGCVLSGTARGPDQWGERWAGELSSVGIERYPADWDAHGRAAGPKRNSEMAAEADALLAFWDGESAGTRDMITKARSAGLDVTVVRMDRKSVRKALLQV